MKENRVLLVEADPRLRKAPLTTLRRQHYAATPAADASEALGLIAPNEFTAAITDVRLPGEMNGLTLLERVGQAHPEIPVIVVTAYGSIDGAVQALKLGATDYVTKPFMPEQIISLLDNILGAQKKRESGFKEIVTSDSQMLHILDQVRSIAPGNASVLIRGETGTGKELIARALHNMSPRSTTGDFVAVNCAAVPDTLLESEMFGHEKGAFTSAGTRRLGKFERADGGTLFLDEIAELSRELQAKLLRALEEHEIERVGGSGPIRVDVRVIACTNEDIEVLINDGRFREDLYYRLDVVTIELPPLRERKGDIPLLARHFLRLYAQEYNKDIEDFTPEAIEKLMAYHWPGNIRHLRNVVEQAVIYSTSHTVPLENVEPERRRRNRRRNPDGGLGIHVGMSMAEVEKIMILNTLEVCGGHKTKAAEILGVTARTIRNKLNQYAEEEASTNEE